MNKKKNKKKRRGDSPRHHPTRCRGHYSRGRGHGRGHGGHYRHRRHWRGGCGGGNHCVMVGMVAGVVVSWWLWLWVWVVVMGRDVGRGGGG